MAWNYDANKPDQDLVWDLRQTYAEIVGEVLKRIAEHRVNKKYPQWFDALGDLYIEINQKLKKKEKEEYKELLNETITSLNNNKQAYLNKDPNNQNVLNVYKALTKLEMWLKVMMEEHRMFGAKEDPELL